MIFDHIGVVVKSIDKGRRYFSEMIAVKEWTQEFVDPVNGVILQFGRDESGVCYEILEPFGDDSPLRTALSDRRAILNHVAYRVSDLESAAQGLLLSGCAPTSDPKPAIAYGNRRIQFYSTPLHFVVELIEAPDHQHLFDWVAS
jgi:methylmalonyl-CoA/ethylmalonyl-CoA epimerase